MCVLDFAWIIEYCHSNMNMQGFVLALAYMHAEMETVLQYMECW